MFSKIISTGTLPLFSTSYNQLAMNVPTSKFCTFSIIEPGVWDKYVTKVR